MISVDDNKAISFDVELSARDVQDLSSVEGVAAFFAKLGYNTNSRTSQTPGNLGITAEGTTRAIRKIYQLADQESLFKVYLFELTSVTVAHIRALVRAFRTLSGNYLLVLTSDYERLDFVLVERYVPSIGDGGSNIAQKQANVRPRTLTVERRNPSRVQLRVLRRLTWTESDPFAQYDKLLSAYSVADWSEELFNNRALFSDYYLLERLRERSEWKDDPKPPYLCLRDLYRDANSRFAGKEEKILRHDLVEPAFAALGLNSREGKRAGSSEPEPDYQLYSTTLKDSPLALCLVYPWGRSLDGKDYERDTVTADENPGAAVVSLLERGEAPWAVVTNGKVWRLYSQRTHSKATNYYEIDLEEVLAATGSQGDPADAFRYFWLLFRAPAFEPVEILREGKTFSQSFLDQLLSESEDYAKQLGERLKGRVFEQVFPHLASGFLAYARDQNGLVADISDEILQRVFQGTLTLLYRLLFLLYAESRDLLPVKEVRGYWESSLKKLKDEIAKAGGTIEDDVPDHLKKAYRADQYSLYDRLAKLFSVIDRGDASLNVPVYNGGLFLSQPEAGDDTPEAEAARFLNSTKVADRFLARAIDLLARDEDSKRHDLVPIDYKSLGVRHLGSIYEGLLEFKVRIATEKLAAVKQKGREVYKPFSELNDRDRERAERHKRIVKKGEVYLENDKRERKASGSYYTPDFIVKYIVEHAVGPVLREKFEKMRPRLREAQKWNRDMTALARSKKEAESKYDHGPAVELKWVSLVDELFDIKVLDPAMGSGHFLVEAVDFITDKTLDFLNSFPWNPVRAHLIDMRETILRQMEDQSINIDEKRLTDVNLLKRQVLKRCIYGVDLNPMAVELAKVSLWLNCFTLGAPLSFLDHHLRCGNSLIGVSVKEVREAIEGKGITVDASDTRSQFSLFGSRFAGLLLATDLMRHVGEMSDVTSAQVRQSRDEYGKASSALQPFKRILDIYLSQWFGRGVTQNRKGRDKQAPSVQFLKSEEAEDIVNAHGAEELNRRVHGLSASDREIAENALRIATEGCFFHWELEFPEVFYGPRKGSRTEIERIEDGGFDAVIGNPPYGITLDESDKQFLRTVRKLKLESSNVAAAFVHHSLRDIARRKNVSFIVPKSLTYSAGWSSILDTMWPNVQSLVDASKAFSDVLLEQVVFHCAEGNGNYYDGGAFTDEVARSVPTPKSFRNEFGCAVCGIVDSEVRLVERILQVSRPLAEVIRVNRGGPWQSYENIQGEVPVLGGKAIGRFHLRPEHVKRAPRAILNETDAGALQVPKIVAQNIVAHIAQPVPHIRIIAAFDNEGTITLDTVNNIYVTDPSIPWEVVVAILNSKLTSWFAYRFIYNQAIRTMHFDAEYIGRLRLPSLTEAQIRECQDVVKKAIHARVDNPDSFQRLDKGLDDWVYRAFDLNPEDIEQIDSTTFHGRS